MSEGVYVCMYELIEVCDRGEWVWVWEWGCVLFLCVFMGIYMCVCVYIWIYTHKYPKIVLQGDIMRYS